METKHSFIVSKLEMHLTQCASMVFVVGFLLNILFEKEIFHEALFGKSILVFLLLIFVCKLSRHMLPNADPYLYPMVVILLSIGLTMLLRLKTEIFMKQCIWVIFSLLLYLLLIRVRKYIVNICQYKYIWGGVGLLFLLLPLMFGENIGGHKSWIILGPLSFQSSEFAKLFVIVFLAGFLAEYAQIMQSREQSERLPFRFFAPLLGVGIIAIGMFVLQHDLGSALLFLGITLSMIYLASGQLLYIYGGASIFACGAGICYILFPHVQTRFNIWLNPWADPNGQSYQVVQSLFSLANGGLMGTGFGLGNPDKIPEVHTDFIFSAIGQEWGFMGAVAIILLYLCFIYRGFKIARGLNDPYEGLLAAGLSAALSLQVFIILAGVTKFLPLTGITLPFLSYGGSSLTANFISVALLFILSERTERNGK